MSLGEKIKVLRENQKISREQFAKQLGISYWALSKYEQNEREPDYKTLILIADYFKVSIDYLLGRIEESGQFFLDETLAKISDDLKKDVLEYVEFLKQKRKT